MHLSTASECRSVPFEGRAGRRNSLYPKGFVGTRAPGDLHAVINAVNMPLDQLSTPAAGLFPEFQHLELLAGQVHLAKTNALPWAYTKALMGESCIVSR